jgi:uncharacterized protein (TIGR02996 family)
MTDPYGSSEWLALVAGIRAAPGNDTPRLVAADWCAEAGDPDRGVYIRSAVWLARNPKPRRPGLVQVMLGAGLWPSRTTRRLGAYKIALGEWLAHEATCEQTMIRHGRRWGCDTAGRVSPRLTAFNATREEYARGFLDRVEMVPALFFLPGVAAHVCRRNPVTRVGLAGLTPRNADVGWYYPEIAVPGAFPEGVCRHMKALAGGHIVPYGWVTFHTETEAVGALSAALIAWALSPEADGETPPPPAGRLAPPPLESFTGS